jgi:predicted CopG family antitoxin
MTKTISLSDEAYKLLRSIKLKDESFSDVVVRLAKKRTSLGALLDLYPELKDVAEYEASVRKVRAKIDEDLREGSAL